MVNSEQKAKDLSAIVKAVGEDLFFEHYERFVEVFSDLAVGYGQEQTIRVKAACTIDCQLVVKTAIAAIVQSGGKR